MRLTFSIILVKKNFLMREKKPLPLETRARNAMLQHAFMRWENATILAGTLLSTFLLNLFNTQLLGVPNWGVLLGGLGLYVAMAVVSLKDEKANARIVSGLLEEQFNPRSIRNKKAASHIREALDYYKRIQVALAKESADSPLHTQLASVADQFDDWIEEMYGLGERLDQFDREYPRLQADAKSTQERMKQLQAQFDRTRDPRVREEIQINLTAMQKQLDTVQSLRNTMDRAELRLENTITAMSTIYSQSLLLDAKDIDNSRYRRLQQEISEEVNELSDILHAMDDVYGEETL